MRVLKSGEVAFLNGGSCSMDLFRTLNSRENNGDAFRTLQGQTQGYYARTRQDRQLGRGGVILSLVEKVLK